MEMTAIKALLFDVGGSMLDWRTGMVTQLQVWGTARGLAVDWEAFAERWRVLGLDSILYASRNAIPRGNIDGVHRQVLDTVLAEFGLEDVSAAQRDDMTLFWHHLPAWPEVPEGLQRLRTRFVVSTLTVLSVPLVISCSREAGMVWDAIISCEMLEEYKPHPSIYGRGVELLGVSPDQAMMVAAHSLDLDAAKKEGLRTALVTRPEEWGPNVTPPDHSIAGDATYDFEAPDLVALARQFGC